MNGESSYDDQSSILMTKSDVSFKETEKKQFVATKASRCFQLSN